MDAARQDLKKNTAGQASSGTQKALSLKGGTVICRSWHAHESFSCAPGYPSMSSEQIARAVFIALGVLILSI
jgi:hypothetical protein